MRFLSEWDASINGWIVVVGCLCSVSAALLGNFLVLRRMSMLGDAITHAVLPGIAAAFFISGSRSSIAMFVGAVVVGLLTAVFTEWIRSAGRVDEGASMGVVFTSLFALGLLMLAAAADHVDLDPKCVLYGAIDLTPLDTLPLGGGEVPRAAVVLGLVLLMNLSFVVLFFKELRVSSFDPALATTMGYSAKAMHYGLMVMVSITAVASFESVGSILVVAMFIVPPAAAYMLTDRLAVMLSLSVVLAIASASLGHVAALEVPVWFGFRSTNTAGPMAVVAGLLFLLAALFGPRYGVVVKWLRLQRLSWRILCDDVVATLYRMEEQHQRQDQPQRQHGASPAGLADRTTLADRLITGRWSMSIAMMLLRRRGQLTADQTLKLTPAGRERGSQLVRSHRLWEQYLVVQTGRQTDRIHGHAERWEHFTDRPLRDELDRVTETPDRDPHGKPIPPEPQRPEPQRPATDTPKSRGSAKARRRKR